MIIKAFVIHCSKRPYSEVKSRAEKLMSKLSRSVSYTYNTAYLDPRLLLETNARNKLK